MVRDTGRRHDTALLLASLALSFALALPMVMTTGSSAPAASANSPPTIASMTPLTGSSFGSDATIAFEAAATDADGDPLTYTWAEGGRVLGKGSCLLLVGMPDGRHTVTLNVTDGKNWTVRSIDLVVEEQQGRSWALPVVGVLVALATAAVVGVYLRRR